MFGNVEIRDSLYSWKFWSWKFIKPRCNGVRRSTFAGNSRLLSSDVIVFAMLPAQRFWRETVLLLDVMWPRSNQWERALLGKIFSHITNNLNKCRYTVVCGGRSMSVSVNKKKTCLHHYKISVLFVCFFQDGLLVEEEVLNHKDLFSEDKKKPKKKAKDKSKKKAEKKSKDEL